MSYSRKLKGFVPVLCLVLIGGIYAPSIDTVNATVVAQATSVATPAGVAYTFSLPSPKLFLDVDWYRQHLIMETDLWNGGLDGLSAMNTYTPKFNGCFIATIDRQWRSNISKRITVISQSRGIYMNVEAYRAAGPAAGQRFLDAVNKGVDCLLKYFKDPKESGFSWEINPTTGTVTDDQKQGYGNVHPLMALANAYAVTHNPAHLQAALDQLEVLKKHFLDPDYPGGIMPGFNGNYSKVLGVKNVDTFTHYFEALLTLYDVTEAPLQLEIGKMITLEGEFLVNRLYNDEAGHTDRGYVAYNYDTEWHPSQEPYTRKTQWSGALQASTGHNVELAYLLSRAVERGFDYKWLDVGEKLLKFVEDHALDPKYGAMIYEITDYAGQPLPDNPDNKYFIWWAQMETARAFLHLAVVRNWNTGPAFKKVEYFIENYVTDHEYGGIYYQAYLDSSGNPAIDGYGKGDVWKLNYHHTMFMHEVLRLSEEYPNEVKAFNANYQPAK